MLDPGHEGSSAGLMQCGDTGGISAGPTQLGARGYQCWTHAVGGTGVLVLDPRSWGHGGISAGPTQVGARGY